jgi:type VI protein secretion system component VasF
MEHPCAIAVCPQGERVRVFGVGVWAILLAAVMGFVLAMLWFGWGLG